MTFSGLVVIEAPHFCAGVVVTRNKVTRVPPILGYMDGWTLDKLREFVKGHRWKILERTQ